jgi:membrane protease subunit HflC
MGSGRTVEQSTTAKKRSNIVLRRTLPAVTAAFAVWALVSSFFVLDITEFGVVTRFGRVVRVLAEPGLHVVAPFDRVVRLDKRILFFRPAPSEYLTVDKKNLDVDSLVTWRIADPVRFLAAVATPSAGEQRLSDIILAEIGAVMGRYPASVLISTDPAKSNYQAIASEVVRRVADFARTAYGIDVVSIDIRRLHLPELNREHVFERMKAERAKIAKENRSAGELEAKRIIAEADHEKIRIDSQAAGQAERIKAEADAEASRTYAAAFGRDPGFYQFLRTLRAYDKVLDEKTTLFLPADADVLRMLHFDAQPVQVGPSPSAPGAISTGADLLLNKKTEEQVR